MIIFQIALVLLCTKIAGQLSARLGQPAVLGEIIVGILIGPALLGWIAGSEVIAIFSQIGVLLLMFLAGIETDLKQMKESQKSALFVAIGGILLPLLMFYLVCTYFEMNMKESIFTGLVFAATSVSISVQVLKELGWLKTKEGSTLLGAAVLDDIVVVILVAFAISFLGNDDTNLYVLVAKKIAFFIILFVAMKWVAPKIIQMMAKFVVSEAVLSAALIVCFSLSYLAESMGVAGIIGAFFAGLGFSKSPYAQEIEKKTTPLAYGFFVPFFFVSIGLEVSFDGIQEQLWLIVVFTIVAILSKLIGSGIGAKITGFNWRSSFGIGAGMISRGEVALILASMGIAQGLLPEEEYTAIIMVVILTTVVTPPMLKGIFGVKKEKNEKTD